jgi:hypothetical protein
MAASFWVLDIEAAPDPELPSTPSGDTLTEDRLMLREAGTPLALQPTLPQTPAPLPVVAPAPQPTTIAEEGGGS